MRRRRSLKQMKDRRTDIKYLSNDPLKMYVAFRIWNSYLLAREPRDRYRNTRSNTDRSCGIRQENYIAVSQRIVVMNNKHKVT